MTDERCVGRGLVPVREVRGSRLVGGPEKDGFVQLADSHKGCPYGNSTSFRACVSSNRSIKALRVMSFAPNAFMCGVIT
jgi:hypothetical protein